MDLIITALVEAGYFRARISNLSDFDKIIGGMAWAMQMFSQEIDINIFYQDTLDLGQKIALTERLVMVLLVMNCPYKIEPHQIVGIDHANLLPVIRWLIMRSAEIRREHEAFNRLLALRHYHRVTNTLPSRDLWCHVLNTNELKGFNSGATANKTDEADEFDNELIKRLKTDFKDNQLISFMNTRPSFVSTVGDIRARQIDYQESCSEDELSEVSEKERDIKENSLSPPPENDEAEVRKFETETSEENVDLKLVESPELVALHKDLDRELLATDQKILTLLKKLDSMPSELEINQYQRRYIELHQELISKNRDLKKVYALFNSLHGVKYYLNKEVNLLESIMSNLDLTKDNPGNRFEFLRQLQDIIKKIQAVRGEVNGRLDLIKKKRGSLTEEYTNLRYEKM